jgi:hypothetical protein
VRVPLIIVLLGLPLCAQVRDSLYYIGHWGGVCHAVATFSSGGHAYAAAGHGGRLVIADIQDPAVPREIGAVFVPGVVKGISIRGTRAYVAASMGGLQIIDIADPSKPKTLGSVSTAGFIHDLIGGAYRTFGDADAIDVNGNIAYLADWFGSFFIIDVSAPANPVRIGWQYDTLDNVLSVAYLNGYVYEANGDRGFKVVDVRDPAHPVGKKLSLGPNVFPSNGASGYGVAVAGNRAYVSHDMGGLKVIDITSPMQPAVLGNLLYEHDTYGQFARSIAVRGKLAFLADDTVGLRIADVTVDTAPAFKARLHVPGGAHGIALAGDYAYMAQDDSGMQVVSIADPTAPALKGSLKLPATAQNVVVDGNIAYVTFGRDGLQVLDLSKPESPARIAELPIQGFADGITLAGGRLYVATRDGLHVIDASQPAHPVELGACVLPKDAYISACAGCDVEASGGYAYVAHGALGLMVVDVKDPAHPALVDSVTTMKGAAALTRSGSVLYVGASYTGLIVADLANPAKPAIDTVYKLIWQTRDVLLEGGRLFVLDDREFRIYNNANPRRPAVQGWYDYSFAGSSGWLSGMAVKGGYAVIVGSNSAAMSLDIADPLNIHYRGGTFVSGELTKLAWAGKLVLGTSYRMGLHVFQPANDPAAAVAARAPRGSGRPGAARRRAPTPTWVPENGRTVDAEGRLNPTATLSR